MRELGWTYRACTTRRVAIRDGPGLIGQPITLFLRRVRGADRDVEWQLPGDALAERIDAILSALRPTIDP